MKNRTNTKLGKICEIGTSKEKVSDMSLFIYSFNFIIIKMFTLSTFDMLFYATEFRVNTICKLLHD